jgi:bacteriocin biosynthesis cyclodehydratase domain-containing protein
VVSREARRKRSVSVIGHSADVVELRCGVWNPKSSTVTDGAGSGRLLQIIKGLDGKLSHKELAHSLGVSRAMVEAVVDHLRTLDMIEWGPTSALDAYLDQVRTLRVGGVTKTRVERVVVFGDGALTETITSLLTNAQVAKVEALTPDDPLGRVLDQVDPAALHDGLRLTELVEQFSSLRGSFLVLAESVINPLKFQYLNRIALELGMPWIHAALDGPFIFIGPTFVPGSSPCYECFETRVTMNLRENASYQRYKDALADGRVETGRPPMLAALRTVLASHTVLEVINFVNCESTFTIGKALGIYLPTMEISFNEVLRLPGCRSCAPQRGRDDSSLYFDARAWING